MHTPSRSQPETRSVLDILTVRVVLAIVAAEGTLALLASLASPSMERRAFILGFSAPRLALETALLLLVILAVLASAKSIVDLDSVRYVIGSLRRFVQSNPTRLAVILFSLSAASVVGAFFLALLRFSLAPNAPSVVMALFLHFSPALLWLTAVPAQLAVAAALLCRSSFFHATARTFAAPTSVLLPLAIFAGGLQCVTLFLRSDLLFGIPGWFWEITPKSYTPAMLLVLPLVAIACLGVIHLTSGDASPSPKTLALSATIFLLLQTAFGVAAGGGLESLRLKYANAPISHEVRAACEYPSGLLPAIRNYDGNFANDFWLGTKPPGLLAVFITVRDVTRSLAIQDISEVDTCFDAVTRVMGILFPVLASLIVFPLYFLARVLRQDSHPHHAALLYMSAPAVLLMPLVRDQAIYPLVATLTIAIVAKSALSRSLPLAATAGVLLYVSAFLSFSLLPLAGLSLAFTMILGFRDRHQLGLSRSFAVVATMAVGLALAWIAGSIFLSYDPIERLRAAMDLHRTIKGVLPGLLSLRQSAFLNTVEFSQATGAPLLLLFLAAAVQSPIRALRKDGSDYDAFALALLCTFGLLYLVGQTRGETARLWLYLVALVAVVAARPAWSMQSRTKSAFLLLFMMQLLVSFVTFMNMDFR